MGQPDAANASPTPPSTPPSTQTPTPTPTQTPTSTPTSTPTPTTSTPPTTAVPEPKAPAPPSPLPITAAVASSSGQDLPLSRDDLTLVDPGAAFRIEVAAHVADGRLALHDEQDAMVASTGTTELGATWTKYQLVPVEPLRPGTRYALHLDGATTREPHDQGGRAFAPLVVKLKTTGDRPAAPKKAQAKRRRR
ncbi:MAG: hypothetical protein ACJ79R_05305 [Anaeromyxobacteraceae bacterium]